MTGPKLGDEGTVAVPDPVADARPGPGRALPRGPGGHPPAPAVGIPPSAAGARGGPDWFRQRCRYCAGSGVLQAIPVGDVGHLREWQAEPVWCVCEWGRRVQLVHGAAWSYVDEHGFAPTVRDLMRSTHSPMHVVRSTVDRLERAGLVERHRRNARSLRVIRGGQA